MRNFKTKSIEAILVSQFPCYFCIKTKVRLSVHLRKSSSCLEKYLLKFNVSSQEALLQIIENLKRRLRNSRSRVSRNLENCRRKEIKAKTTKEAKRSVELINNFRKDTTWCREKLCYKCKQNINNGEKITIEEVTVDLAHVDERDILKLRRFESYFCCQDCSNKKTTNFQPNIEIQSLSHEDKTFFVPSALLPCLS